MADDCNAVVAVLLLLLHSCPYGVGSNSQVYEENLFLRGLPCIRRYKHMLVTSSFLPGDVQGHDMVV